MEKKAVTSEPVAKIELPKSSSVQASPAETQPVTVEKTKPGIIAGTTARPHTNKQTAIKNQPDARQEYLENIINRYI